MRAPEDYLAIPTGYSRWFGGVRWTDDGEAVEYNDREPDRDRTFAFAGEVSLFLEGFQQAGPPPCFGFALHLMSLLGVGRRSRPPASHEPGRQPSELAWLFHMLGRPLRNAGALWAVVARDVPRAADPPPLSEVCARLTQRPTMLALRKALRLPEPLAEAPPLSALVFEARMLRALAAYSTEELRAWLRYGRPPVNDVGEEVAREVEGARPRSFLLALAALERRPRLGEAASLVAQVDAALTLPPRRLAATEFPSGGYADIGTRGRPEQLLPSQFALDATEFLRRLAERELLYYQREEPKRPVAEQVWLLIDQGVRTWGEVRPILAASAIALARRAHRRGQDLRVATTADPSRLVDPLDLTEAALGELFEASDLTPHPAALLQTILEQPAGAARDLILLTHPRSLGEPELSDAARRAGPGTRLFAVAVDRRGEVILSEILRGSPIRLGGCRVALDPIVAEPPTRAVAPSNAAWSGPVEPVGFPFALGLVEPVADHLFDFDEAGDWLFTASPSGKLDAWRTDGSVAETFPRAMVDGQPLALLDDLVGVAGGVAVLGRGRGRIVLAHYDFRGRACRVYALGETASNPCRNLHYHAELHSVTWRTGPDGEHVVAVDLAVSDPSAIEFPAIGKPGSTRARIAAGRSVSCIANTKNSINFCLKHVTNAIDRDAGPATTGATQPLGGPETGESAHWLTLLTVQETGTLRIGTPDDDVWPPIRPVIDGEPALKGRRVGTVAAGGDYVAASFPGPDRRGPFFVFQRRGDATEVVASLPMDRPEGFTLSRDGKLLARKVADRRLEVCEVRGLRPRLATTKGKIHTQLVASLGDEFLILRAGEQFHFVRWGEGVLDFAHGHRAANRLVEAAVAPGRRETVATSATTGARPSALYDPVRFRSWCERRLLLAIDTHSQAALFDAEGHLVCMMVRFRDRFAAWMPDGTRLGHPALLGGEPTPGAAERIGAALKRASDRGRP